MSSCLNLRRTPTSPVAGARTNTSGGLSTSSEVSKKPHDEMHPQDENEPPCFEIGMPYDLKHEVHIHYNFKEARYEGVPDNFAEFLVSGLQNSKKSSAASALSASFSSITKPSQRIKRSRTGSNNSTGAGSHCNSSNLLYDSKMDAGLAACAGATDPQSLLNQHFKVHFRQVPRLAVPGYDDRIPAVLVMLQKHFMAKQGYLLPHIFRESPNKSDRDQAMREINTGTFSGASHDVRVLADLIKLWFRELPVPIFHEIRADHMEKIIKMGGVDVANEVLGMLGPLERCIVLWLADLLAYVAEYQTQNHMGVDQLAIIIAPNLVRIETENPMLAVALSKAAVDVFRCIRGSKAAE
uniref:Rho-GAP domain-containing protein n=1 Tax=Globisporangium ultimum (strain ATCC 200006 / CBS 805.95 / DAOM BR144) TaxID=431595 RepID=K3XAS7_GLOUD